MILQHEFINSFIFLYFPSSILTNFRHELKLACLHNVLYTDCRDSKKQDYLWKIKFQELSLIEKMAYSSFFVCACVLCGSNVSHRGGVKFLEFGYQFSEIFRGWRQQPALVLMRAVYMDTVIPPSGQKLRVGKISMCKCMKFLPTFQLWNFTDNQAVYVGGSCIILSRLLTFT